jgi:hypothetical protein
VLITLPLEDHSPTTLMMDFPRERSVEDALLALGPKADVVGFFLPVERPLDHCAKPDDCSTVLTELCRLAGDRVGTRRDDVPCGATCANGFRVLAPCEASVVERAEEARAAADRSCPTYEACLESIRRTCGECADQADWEAGSICSFRCCGETETRIATCR